MSRNKDTAERRAVLLTPLDVGFRRLARDHEGLPLTSEAFITIAMSRLMLSRLVPLFP